MVVRCETGDAGTSHLTNHMRSHRKEPALEESRDHRIHRHGEDAMGRKPRVTTAQLWGLGSLTRGPLVPSKSPEQMQH